MPDKDIFEMTLEKSHWFFFLVLEVRIAFLHVSVCRGRWSSCGLASHMPQWRHFLAAAIISSPQYGHLFVSFIVVSFCLFFFRGDSFSFQDGIIFYGLELEFGLFVRLVGRYVAGNRGLMFKSYGLTVGFVVCRFELVIPV